MPYEIKMQGDKHCVFNKETGDSKGCSDTHEMAVKHMRALYAAESGSSIKNKMIELLTEGSTDIDAFLTEAIEKAITDAPEPSRVEPPAQPITSVAVEHVDTPQVSFFSRLFNGLRPQTHPVSGGHKYIKTSAPLVLTKSADGRTRVLMRVSNIFKDRHGEIITTEAHEDYVNWVYAKQEERMPEFWLYHIKGSRWGQADFVDFSDGFITVSGLVDPGYEHIASKLAEMGKSLGVSHGFYGLSLTNKGFIDLYRDFEVSPLPLKHAANVWTALTLAKEAGLPLSEDRRNFLIKDLGVPETVVEEWGKTNKELHDILKENNVAWKDEDEPTPSVPAPANIEVAGPTLADVMAKLTSMSDELTTVKAAQKALESRTDDAVASALEAAIVSGKGFVPSQSKDNAPSGEEANKTVQDNWWEEVVMKPALNRS